MTRGRFELRAATEKSYDAVFDLFAELQAPHTRAHGDLYRAPAKDEIFRGYFDKILNSDEASLILAYLDDSPVGFVEFSVNNLPASPTHPALNVVCMHQLVVARQHRRKGYATELVDFVKAYARDHEISHIYLTVDCSNDAAPAYFARQGFEIRHQTMWLKT